MGSKPKVVQQDPEGDARRAAEKATAEANQKKAMRRGGGSSSGAFSVLGTTEESANADASVRKGLPVGRKATKLGGG
ncbi:hypothetical protein ABEF83_08125 [Acinetobacter thermotolerans]|uniref:hypothetical protein n=1 Tax=Acinetobacter thermotolerans TaxID=3151487 RepID=UPI00325B0FE8